MAEQYTFNVWVLGSNPSQRTIFYKNNLIMARKYSKGYYEALRHAHGDESKVKHNYGWYYDDGYGPEYDDNGEPIAFT